MSQLNSIRIQNLRSLTDTTTIQLKPLTVLVGKNSVGKSTFARTFPLLRQTCEAQKKSPILWSIKKVPLDSICKFLYLCILQSPR